MIGLCPFTPVDDDPADDHQVLVNDREVGATPVGAEHAELLVQRNAPERFSGFAIDAQERCRKHPSA